MCVAMLVHVLDVEARKSLEVRLTCGQLVFKYLKDAIFTDKIIRTNEAELLNLQEAFRNGKIIDTMR